MFPRAFRVDPLPRSLFKGHILENFEKYKLLYYKYFSRDTGFYTTSRTYTISEKSIDQLNCLRPKKISQLRKEIKYALDAEQKIRYHQNCDRILFELIRMLLDREDSAIEIQNICGLSTLEKIQCNFSLRRIHKI